MNPLTRNWLLLVAMVVATTLLAPFSGAVVTAALLVLAFLKAGAILGGFLHLSQAPGWRTAMLVPLGLWMTALWVLYQL